MKKISFDTLVKQLNPVKGTVSINTKSLSSALSSFLSKYYFSEGKVLEIKSAKQVQDASSQTVVITGRASYLNIPNRPLNARFWIDDQGNVQASLTYTMIESATSTSRWAFSNSFPELPLTDIRVAGSKNHEYERLPCFSNFDLLSAKVSVCSQAMQDSDFDVPLQEGINFAGQIRPLGLLGIVENFLKNDGPQTIFGQIITPQDDTQIVLPHLNQDVSRSTLYPWEIEDYTLPGIHLSMSVPLEFKIGKAKFQDTKIQFYCPLKPDMFEPDSPYNAPVCAFTGTLKIPSAGMAMYMVADLDIAGSYLNIEGRFENLSIENLAKLASITGSGASSLLPKPLSQVMKPLKALELTELAVGFYWDQGPVVDDVSIGIGMPDLEWEIWKDHVILNGIGSRFMIESPFRSPNMSVSLWGKTEIEGCEVDFSAQEAGSDIVVSIFAYDLPIPLKQLMKSYASGVPAPANMTVNTLELILSSALALNMSGALAQKPDSWDLDLGPAKLTIANVMFDFAIRQGASFTGSFRGELNIGKNIKISAQYNVPGEFVIRGEAGQLRFRELLSKLTNQNVTLPKELNFTLINASVMIKKGASGLVFQLASQVEGFGFMAFEVKKVNGQWGAAAGISLDSGLSDVPGLGALKAIEKLVLMEDFVLVVSTYDGPQFRFPDMAAFSNPALSNANVQLPASAGGVVSGLNSYSRWQLGNNGRETEVLQKLLGLDPTLRVTLQISAPPQRKSSMYTSLETKLNGTWPMSTQVGVALNNGVPGFFAAGNAKVKINGRKYSFDTALSFVGSGAYFSGSMLGTVNLNGVKLSNLALMASMNWAGIPSIGLAGTIDVSNFSSSIAVFFDSADPSKSVFAGAVSDLNLADVVTSIAGVKKLPKDVDGVLDSIELKGTGSFTLPLSLADALDNLELDKIASAFAKKKIPLPTAQEQVLIVVKKKGKLWSLTNLYDKMKHYTLEKGRDGITVTLDAQLYCVPRPTRLGQLSFAEGTLINGAVSVLGLTATSKVEISNSKGISLAADLDKALTIYKPKFFQLSTVKSDTGIKAVKSKGPRLSISTFRQPENPIKEFQNPHVYLNGRLYFLGLEGESFVRLSNNGFDFWLNIERDTRIDLGVVDGKSKEQLSVQGNFSNVKALKAEVGTILDYELKLDFKELGKLRLQTQVKGKVTTSFDGKNARVQFAGAFKYKSQSYKVTLAMKADAGDVEQLAKLVAKEIEKAFTEVFKSAEQWAKFAKNGVMEGVDTISDTTKVLEKKFNQSAGEAAKTLRSAGHTMNDIGGSLKTVYQLDSKDMKSALQGAGYAASSVDKFVSSSYKDAAKSVTKAAKSTGKAVSKASKKTKKKTKKTGKKIKKAFR